MRAKASWQTDTEITREREMFYGFKVIITQTARGKNILRPPLALFNLAKLHSKAMTVN